MTAEEIARTVRGRRKELRLSRRTLAELAEVAVHTVANVETARANPTLEVLTRILRVLGLEVSIRPRAPGAGVP